MNAALLILAAASFVAGLVGTFLGLIYLVS
jgi:hypothetical protein